MDGSRVPGGSGHHGNALVLPLDVTHTGHGGGGGGVMSSPAGAALDVGLELVRSGLTPVSAHRVGTTISVPTGLDWTGLSVLWRAVRCEMLLG